MLIDDIGMDYQGINDDKNKRTLEVAAMVTMSRDLVIDDDTFKASTGLPQGSKVAPMFYNLAK